MLGCVLFFFPLPNEIDEVVFCLLPHLTFKAMLLHVLNCFGAMALLQKGMMARITKITLTYRKEWHFNITLSQKTLLLVLYELMRALIALIHIGYSMQYHHHVLGLTETKCDMERGARADFLLQAGMCQPDFHCVLDPWKTIKTSTVLHKQSAHYHPHAWPTRLCSFIYAVCCHAFLFPPDCVLPCSLIWILSPILAHLFITSFLHLSLLFFHFLPFQLLLPFSLSSYAHPYHFPLLPLPAVTSALHP